MWQIKIQDPSGETRKQRLPALPDSPISIGRALQNGIYLRDPRVPLQAAQIWVDPDGCSRPSQSRLSPFWFRVSENAPAALLGDLMVREGQLPIGLPLTLGETRILIEPESVTDAVPTCSPGIRPWLTSSESGRQLLWTVKKTAATPLSIYLAGETGTGKEVLAHLIHHWSPRAAGSFVAINCGALPLSLAESELFGHTKGAFTGATHPRAGALLQAHNGTLFLDEIGDLPLDIQVKLLRFLENGELRAVGSDRTSRADVRILCATHKPLAQLVQEGKFRRDLYYRLASVKVEIPPLRSRLEDIEMLARQFASTLDKTISPSAMIRLQAHSWPGNVRELRHAIERASGMTGPFHSILNESAFDFLLASDGLSDPLESDLALGAPLVRLDEMERHLILKVLRLTGGNRSRAARILGVGRSTLFEKMKKYKIIGPRAQMPDVA